MNLANKAQKQQEPKVAETSSSIKATDDSPATFQTDSLSAVAKGPDKVAFLTSKPLTLMNKNIESTLPIQTDENNKHEQEEKEEVQEFHKEKTVPRKESISDAHSLTITAQTSKTTSATSSVQTDTTLLEPTTTSIAENQPEAATKSSPLEKTITESTDLTEILSSSLSLKTQRSECRIEPPVLQPSTSLASTPFDQGTIESASAPIPLTTVACSTSGSSADNCSASTSWTSSITNSFQNSFGAIASGFTEQDLVCRLSETDGVLLRGSSSPQDNLSLSGDNKKNSTGLSFRVKKKSWYNVLYPNYKSRAEDFKKLFKDVPNEERLIVDYSCALQREILVQGRMYVSQNYVCFHANIFRWETYLSIKWEDVTSITKEKTALVIPNAISIATAKEKFFFATFTARDKAFLMLFRVWQNTLMKKPMQPQEIWQWVHNCYGDELGLTTDDEDYIDPSTKACDDADTDFQSTLDDTCLASDYNNTVSSNSNQSLNQLGGNQNHRYSGNSSGSSGGGVGSTGVTFSATREAVNFKSLAKPYILAKNAITSVTVSTSSSDNKGSVYDMNPCSDEARSLVVDVVKPQANSHASGNENTGSASGGGGGGGAIIKTTAKEHKSNVYEGKRRVTKNNRQRDENLSKNTDALPTDMSASSDSDENKIPFVPTVVCNSLHEGRQVLHTLLPINIDTLFNMLFSKSKFLVDFHNKRRTENMEFGDWVNNKDGTQSRTFSLTVQVSASVGPKTARVTENQEMRDCSKPGELYSIDVISTNSGIPYADSFCVLMHFCLVRTADDNTMLSMHAQVKYKKSVWGVVKSLIEKNTWAGLEDFYTNLQQALQNETNIPPAKSKGRRPRRGNTNQRRVEDEALAAVQTKTDSVGNLNATTMNSTSTQHLPTSPELLSANSSRRYKWMSLFVIFLLCFLILLNVILLHKLWRLEARINDDVNSRARLPNLSQLKELPNTNEEWVNLLRQQEILHERELKKWHKVLQTAIELLKKTEKMLAALMLQ